MNKVYKVIYSKVKQCNVVVSEIAKSHGRHTKSSVAKKKAALAAATLTLPGLIAVETMPTAEAEIVDHNEVAGGKDNTTGGTYSTIAGGSMNSTGAYGALVAGGNSNVATSLVGDKNYEVDYDRQYYDECSTVAGGYKNTALGDYSTLVGGSDGVIQGRYSTGIAGGSTGARADHALAMGFGAVVTDDGVLKTITDFTNKATGEVTKQVAYSNVSTAIGYQATANQAGTISFGHDKGDVSGYTVTWQQDTPDALGVYHNSPKDGTHNRYDLAPTVTANTYDSSYYNRLVKLADGINGRDAVTMRQAAVSNGDKADTTADNIGANYKVVKTDELGNVVYDEQTGLPTLVAASDDQKKANESAWGTALGTGKVESGNDQLVTGGTVYDAIKDIPTSASLAGKADVTADNIGKNLKKNANGADASDADQKANAVEWGKAIGLGAVNENDDKLMTSNGVYSEVRPSDGNYIHSNSTTAQNLTALDTQVKHNADAISNITYTAGNGITLDNKQISAKAGTGITVDDNGISIHYNTSHLKTGADGALDVVSNGAIADGNTGLVTGATVFDYLKNHTSGSAVHFFGVKDSDATSTTVNYNGNGASGDKTVAIGSGVSVTGDRSNSVGYKNTVAGTLSDVYGNGNTINEGTHNAVVLGNSNKVGSNSVAIGTWDKEKATNSVFIGGDDVSTTESGSGSPFTGWEVGKTNPDGSYTVVDGGPIHEATSDEVGDGEELGAKRNPFFGDEEEWDDEDTNSSSASAKAAPVSAFSANSLFGPSIGFGDPTDTTDKVTVVGKSADASGVGSVSLGYGAKSANGNIAIGYNSLATEAVSKEAGYLTGSNAPNSYVSIGDGKDGSDTKYRRITNVADGSDNQDAVTVAQLRKTANADASNIGANLKKADGTTAADTSDITANEKAWGTALGTGNISTPADMLVTDTTIKAEVRPANNGEYVKANQTTAQNLTALDSQVKTNAETISSLSSRDVQYDMNEDGKTVNKGKITLAGGTDGTTITNVKAGTDEKDAVNVKQLNDKIADVTYTEGNGITFGTDKTISAKAGTGITVDATGISVNLGKHLSATGTGAIDVEDNGTVTENNTNLVTGGTVYNALHGALTDITVGKDGKDGTDGKDGSIGLNGKNGENGKDGITTTIIKTEKGQPGEKGETGAPGVDGKDITRIVYQNDKNGDGKHTVATLDDGMKYAGDDSQDTTKIIAKKLNETLNIIGGAKGDLSLGNIGVNNVDGSLKIQLAKDLKDLNSSTYTMTERAGESDQQKTTTYTTVINGKGLTIQSGEQGSTTAASGPSITIDGINGGGKQITNIGDGITKDTEGKYTISDTDKKNAANIGDVQTIVNKATKDLTEGTNGLNSKANIDASNIGDKLSYKADGTTVTVADKTANKNAWGAAIGTGVIADPVKTEKNDPAANGSQQLVTGGTVYTALTNKANIDMDNISDNGKTVIRNLAKGAVKVVDGILTTVTSKQDGDATAYMVNIKKGQVTQNDDGLVTGSAVYDAIQGAKLSGGSGQTVDLSGKVDVSADNVGQNFSKFSADATTDEAKKQEVTANENAWGNALGTGRIANSDSTVQDADSNGSKQLVTGNTVYKEVRPTSDGTYVKTDKTTAQNLTELDTQLGKVSGSAVQYDTVQGGTTVDKTKLTLAGVGGTTISNVKAGTDDTDAVNVKQLNDRIADVTYTEGNGITFGTDKTISAKAGTGITVDATGISVNLGKHLSANGTNGAIDVEDNGTVTENNTDLVTGGTVYNALHGGLTDITVGKDGKDGSIGLNGKDGKDGIMTTIIKTEKGQPGEKGETGAPGVDGKDITRIVYQNAKNDDGKHTVATLDDGMKYAGDTGDIANVKLDHQLKLSGTTFGADKAHKSYDDKDWTSDNIAVVSSKVGNDGNAVMNLKLAKDLKDLHSSTYTTTETTGTGDQQKSTTYTTTIDSMGLTIQSSTDGTTTNGPSVTKDGINAGGKAITNIGSVVKDGKYTDDQKNNAATLGDVSDIVKAEVKDVNTDLTDVKSGLDKKANIDASNIGSKLKNADGTADATDEEKLANENAWGIAIGTGKVADPTQSDTNGSKQLVTGGTVYTAIHDTLNGGIDNVVFGHDGQDGQDGSIGLVGPKGQDGKDGKTTTIIKTETGAAGVNGKDGKDGITRIVYNDKDNTNDKHTVATLDDGMKYVGDTGDVANVKLDHQLKLSGTTFGADKAHKSYDDKDWTSDNIAVVSSKVGNDGNAVMNLKLAKDLKDLNSSTYTSTKTTGEDDQKKTTTYTTVINGKGLTIQSGEQGSTTGPSITIDGINAGGKAITNLTDGTLSDSSTDAVTGKQLYAEQQERVAADTAINDKLGTLDTQVKANADAISTEKHDREAAITNITNNMNSLTDSAVQYDKDSNKGTVTLAGTDGTTIKNLKAGEVAETSKDAVNGSQLYAEQQERVAADTAINNKIDTLDTQVKTNADAISKNTSDIQNLKDSSSTINTKLETKADTDLGNITDAGKQVIKNTMKDDMDKKANVADMAQKANVDASNIDTSKWAKKLGTGTVAPGDNNLVTGDTVNAAISGIKGSSLVQSDGKTLTIGSKDTATKVDISGQDAKGNKTGRVITGVVSDASDPNSAANVGYVNGVTAASNEQIYRDMNMQYNRVENDISRAAAGSNALAALHPMQEFDPDDKAQFAVGYGHYRNANAGAVGAFYQPDENSMVNFGVSFGNGDAGINAGVTFKFGPGGSGHHALTKTQMAKVINTQAKEIEALKQDNADKDKRIDALEQKMAEILARLDKSQAGA